MKKGLLALLMGFCCAYSWGQTRTETDLSGPGWKMWLDKDAEWEKDSLYFPPVALASLPVHRLTKDPGNEKVDVSVPGTVEEYLQKEAAPQGDLKGVSWWWREIMVPNLAVGQRSLLRFESVRCRAEVFLDNVLVGYDLIGNTPFEVDITQFAKPGKKSLLLVRITDPGGNFDWTDNEMMWGKTAVSGSHGFGGITGRVKLITCNPVYINDIYLQNTAAITKAIAKLEITNKGPKPVKKSIAVKVFPKGHPESPVFEQVLPAKEFPVGNSVTDVTIDVPTAKLWDPGSPNLYTCQAKLLEKTKPTDSTVQTFGFRWFEASGIGSNAIFKLNGKRIFLKTAISWGFWPVNGIFPTPEMAEKQIKTAKDLGLNMLNFHRCIGNPIVMEKADSMGLLYYEEPGNYYSGVKFPVAAKWNTEKLKRMVRRDRSHPCMIIYNMQNEMRDVDSSVYKLQRADMAAAHAIDPSRIITRTSGWAQGKDIPDQAKLHARPFDSVLHNTGWYDYHRAPGPHVWYQKLYEGPDKYYGYTDNLKEIVYNGEEGALSTPPRVGLIQKELEKQPRTGWDGWNYKKDVDIFANFFEEKKLKSDFGSLDAFTKAMGKISLYHQGRKIENNRICDANDGYAVNGWESEPLENHSGIVDCYRNPKADPQVMAYYNQAMYVAVKPRAQVVNTADTVLTDFYLVNETGRSGKYVLSVVLVNSNGYKKQIGTYKVTVKGGDVFGETLATGIAIPLGKQPGMYRIEAVLYAVDGNTAPQVNGKDEVLAVDWRSDKIQGKGAVWEYGQKLQGFLQSEKGYAAVPFDTATGKMDWILTSRSPKGGDITIVPQESLVGKDGTPGLDATYFLGAAFEKEVAKEKENYLDLIVNQGATPHPKVATTFGYSIRWEGKVVPPHTGKYRFQLEYGYGGTGKLVVNGQELKWDAALKRLDGTIDLEKGKAIDLLVELKHSRHSGACRLFWSTPDTTDLCKTILDQVNEGSTLVIIDNADKWMDSIAARTGITYKGKFAVGTNWLGGVHFVKPHALFNGLPTGQGMDWPYEMVVRKGNERIGLDLKGEELVAGAYHCYPTQLGTAVGVVRYGKGKIVFSTLDIYGSLLSGESTAEVSRKLLCNYLTFAVSGL